MSNGNKTATHTNTNNNAGVRSTSARSAGRYYFEYTVGTWSGNFDCVGVLMPAGTYTNLVTNGTNCAVVYHSTGNIYSNGVFSSKSLGGISNGQVVQVAVDLDNELIWFRIGTNNWNNTVGADPTTATSGVSISNFSGTTLAPAAGFGGASTGANDNGTANFGASAFSQSVPTGFTAGWAA